MRGRAWCTHTALVTGSVVLTLLAVEGVLRLFPALGGLRSTPAEKPFFTRYDAELGWAPRPSVAGVHRDDGFAAFVSQNAWGLRAPDDAGPERRGLGRRRVLVLGDSYVWGYGASQDELFTDRRVHGSDLELLNFGVSGYGTDQELLFYRRLGTRFDVDEVVLAFTPYNDVENNLEPEQYGYAKPYFVLNADGSVSLHREHLHESRWDDAVDALLYDSRSINLLVGGSLRVRNGLLNRFATPLGAAEARARLLGALDVTARDRAGLQLTAALIRRLRDEVKAHGAEFSVVFVPYKPHTLTGQPHNHPFVPLLATALSAEGIPYYDPYGVFLRESRNGPPLFNALDNHFSAAGHRLFAHIFTDPAVRAETLDVYDRRPIVARTGSIGIRRAEGWGSGTGASRLGEDGCRGDDRASRFDGGRQSIPECLGKIERLRCQDGPLVAGSGVGHPLSNFTSGGATRHRSRLCPSHRRSSFSLEPSSALPPQAFPSCRTSPSAVS